MSSRESDDDMKYRDGSLSSDDGMLIPREPPDGAQTAGWGSSVGDWLCTVGIWAIGSWADKLPPFERELKPQLKDPNIAYHHTPADIQQYPSVQLWRVSLYLPLAVLAVLALATPPRALAAGRMRLVAELWLGLLSSVGLAFTVVSLVKSQVGRLRPDFLARCVPVNGVCTGVASVVEEGRRSFPSGHSALSFSALGFVSLCLGARLVQAPGRSGTLWKLCVVALPWLLALHVALSRVADYWHHWEDVLVGSLLGHVLAYTAYRLRFVAPSAGLVPHYHLHASHGGEVPDKRRAHTSPPEHV